MTALAYLLPPVTGLVAYFRGRSGRARFHGLQSIALGVAWPAALYGADLVGRSAVAFVAAAGAVAWLYLIVGAALGRDPRLPGGAALRRVIADAGPTDAA
ncbi:MAG: hypothetical protein ACRDKB_14635 [Actinomycetota bacterium]